MLPGSSPQAWGIGYRIEGVPLPVRFIPTGVGNSDGGPEPDGVWRFIPTGVGNSTADSKLQRRHRFIPTGVGNSRPGGRLRQRRRFIPTGVGNRSCSAPAPSTRTVHPHRRGE